MFRALLAHTQEELHKRYLVYSVRVRSVGYTRIEVEPKIILSSISLIGIAACTVITNIN
jgi:hypothetical protein